MVLNVWSTDLSGVPKTQFVRNYFITVLLGIICLNFVDICISSTKATRCKNAITLMLIKAETLNYFSAVAFLQTHAKEM